MQPIETLEARRMMSVNVLQQGGFVSVDGTNGSDHVTIENNGSNGLRIKDGQTTKNLWGVEIVRIELFGGTDRLVVKSPLTHIRYDINMGSGDDFIEPNGGEYFIQGGDGSDEVSYAKFGIALYLTNSGNDFSGYLNSTRDDKIFADVEHIRGGSGNDQIFGNAGMNRLKGGPGHDQIYGGGGTDFLMGEAGNDLLHGGIGSDYFWGGKGSDTFYANEIGLGGVGWPAEKDWIVGDDTWKKNDAGSYDVLHADWTDVYDKPSVEKVYLPIFVFHP